MFLSLLNCFFVTSKKSSGLMSRRFCFNICISCFSCLLSSDCRRSLNFGLISLKRFLVISDPLTHLGSSVANTLKRNRFFEGEAVLLGEVEGEGGGVEVLGVGLFPSLGLSINNSGDMPELFTDLSPSEVEGAAWVSCPRCFLRVSTVSDSFGEAALLRELASVSICSSATLAVSEVWVSSDC